MMMVVLDWEVIASTITCFGVAHTIRVGLAFMQKTGLHMQMKKRFSELSIYTELTQVFC